MFLSFTTGAVNAARIAYPFGAPDFTLIFSEVGFLVLCDHYFLFLPFFLWVSLCCLSAGLWLFNAPLWYLQSFLISKIYIASYMTYGMLLDVLIIIMVCPSICQKQNIFRLSINFNGKDQYYIIQSHQRRKYLVFIIYPFIIKLYHKYIVSVSGISADMSSVLQFYVYPELYQLWDNDLHNSCRTQGKRCLYLFERCYICLFLSDLDLYINHFVFSTECVCLYTISRSRRV